MIPWVSAAINVQQCVISSNISTNTREMYVYASILYSKQQLCGKWSGVFGHNNMLSIQLFHCMKFHQTTLRRQEGTAKYWHQYNELRNCQIRLKCVIAIWVILRYVIILLTSCIRSSAWIPVLNQWYALWGHFRTDVASCLTSCLCIIAGPLFTKTTPSYGYRDPHYKPKTVWRPSQVYNGNPYTDKTASSLWIEAQASKESTCRRRAKQWTLE